MKKINLLCCLLIWLSIYETVSAQGTPGRSKALTITMEDAARYVGSIVKLNYERYKTADDGKVLTIFMIAKRPENSLTLLLTGKSRKTLLEAMRSRRELNRQIKQSLDTSITATGKIVSYQGRPRMVVSRPLDVYLGADLQLQQP